MDDPIKSGRTRLVGDRKLIDQLKSMLVQFDAGFEALPGTAPKDLTPEKKTFAHQPLRSKRLRTDDFRSVKITPGRRYANGGLIHLGTKGPSHHQGQTLTTHRIIRCSL
jgi:hypothetical protein